jgi:hypothetical protein
MMIRLLACGAFAQGIGAGPAAPVVVAGGQLVQGAKAFDLGPVGGDDPPVGRAGVLAAGDPAAFEPPEQGRCRHPDLAGEGGQRPLAGPEAALAGARVMVQAGAQAQPADQVLDLARMEVLVQAGRAEALGRKPAGYHGTVQALAGQGRDPLGQRPVVGQLLDPGDRAVRTAWVWWPPAQVTVAWTRSVAPSAVTWMDSMTARSSRLRSATVVVGAAHSAGMPLARARIAASSAADSRGGRCRW